MGVFYCPFCRLTTFAGRRHLYSASHQRRLREALGRLQAKVQLARKMVKNAVVVKYEAGEHDQVFWCLCCKQDVKRHLSHGNLTVLHGGLLQHMASLEHKKEANKFWWENKAEAKLKQEFLISPEDYERFKSSLVKALDAYEEREDEVIKKMASHIREVEQSRQEMVQAVLEVCFPRMHLSSIQQMTDCFHKPPELLSMPILCTDFYIETTDYLLLVTCSFTSHWGDFDV
uniref:Coiled-coil domain containing 84 n=1 Tax=Pelusios castaneus TaxID=367368 RepID=A0A8C8VJ38_9SAUR